MPDSDILESIRETSDTEELRRILAAAESRLTEVISEKRKEIARKIAELAASVGLAVEIRTKAAAGKQSKHKKYPPTTRPPKYRNPANPEETWHGRGPRPEWFRIAEEEKEIPREEMEIA